jgi:hypothetical protein
MTPPSARIVKRCAIALFVALLLYLGLAYVALPMAWRHHAHQPGLADKPMVTKTKAGIPGDPINIGLVGSRDDVLRAMQAAGWSPADPVTLRSSLKIIGSVLLNRPDRTAPVSRLLYAGRPEDLAFERPEGRSARRRHHIRLWLVMAKGAENRPVWLGADTFDQGIGFSHDTGEVTHKIAPDIDDERAYLTASLVHAGMVQALYQVSGIGPTLSGRNGEGNLYRTDGEIQVLDLVPDGRARAAPPVVLDAPPLAQISDDMVHAAASALK